MERPTNPMITGVLMLPESLSLLRLKHVVKKRFLSYARFRQKPVETPTGAAWQQDPHFDLDWHVRKATISAWCCWSCRWAPTIRSPGWPVANCMIALRTHGKPLLHIDFCPRQDPDAVVQRFGAEFDKLVYLALMGAGTMHSMPPRRVRWRRTGRTARALS